MEFVSSGYASFGVAVGGLMPSVMVGLLAAVATAMPALVPFAHGSLISVIILEAAVAAFLVVICTAPGHRPTLEATLSIPQKKL
jgi:hypothetical protein